MQLLLTTILVFIILDVLMVGYILYRRSQKKISKDGIHKIRSQWKQIIAQPDRRHAIMDADKLLDYALTEMGMYGNLGSKLKKAPRLFKNINDIWSAHKIRNNIAHQIDYQVTEKIYKKTMLSFKRAFEDLGVF